MVLGAFPVATMNAVLKRTTGFGALGGLKGIIVWMILHIVAQAILISTDQTLRTHALFNELTN